MMTALGRSELLRTYFACPGCGQGDAHVDRLLGLDGFLTRQATRLICLTGGRIAFAPAAGMLQACCGWTVSDETIRLACQGQSGPIAEFHATPAAGAAFAEAAGDVEFQLDGTTVNTTGGWRDMKVGILARREPGEKATAAEWDSRDLPGPTARVAFAAIEPIDRFAPRIGEWAGRPFFSRASTWAWRVFSKARRRNSRPLPSKRDSQRSMTWPAGAEPAVASSSLARARARSTIRRGSGVMASSGPSG